MFQRSSGSFQLCIRQLMNVKCMLKPRHEPRLFKIAPHRQIAVICLQQLCFWHEALLVQLPMASPLRPGCPAALLSLFQSHLALVQSCCSEHSSTTLPCSDFLPHSLTASADQAKEPLAGNTSFTGAATHVHKTKAACSFFSASCTSGIYSEHRLFPVSLDATKRCL